MNSVQTVVDVEPTEAPQPAVVEKEEPEIKEETKEPEVVIKEEPKVEAEAETKAELEKVPAVADLGAIYVRDTVTDGTVLPPNHVFEQTWVLRNTGKVAWPAGCAVKFVGGDYMGHVDPNHPAGISELVSASESTLCYETLEPGKEYPFTVLLRTPSREGKIISYWRLTTKDGIKFGHRLWCDVTVLAPKVKEEVAAPSTEKEKETSPAPTTTSSQVIFPKLEKESPVSSIHEPAEPASSEPSTVHEPEEEVDDFDDCQEWDVSDDGFMTDEEYDILDASDEEYLEEQRKKLLKK
jgi:next-to-BRCA1 protein 1